MIIRPVTDLRNHFPEVETQVKEEGAVYLTKNGYATAVLLDVSEYESLKGRNEAPTGHKTKRASNRGFLHKYANPELIPMEREAGKLFVAERYKKYLAENHNDE